ncbi:MAG TPA: hypothetical protein VF211_12825 [Burkholderiales bacterium]
MSGLARRALTRPYAAVAVALVAFLASLLLMLVLPLETFRRWTSEEGFFEQASWIGYLAAGALCLLMARRDPRLYLPCSVVLLAMCARELDWHRRFTTDSFLKSRYFLKVQAPLAEKLIAGAVVLALTALVLYLVVRYWRPFLRALRARVPAAVTLATTVALLVVTKTADRLPGILRDDYGLRLPDALARLDMVLEEPMELAIPLLILLAIAQARAGASAARAT